MASRGAAKERMEAIAALPGNPFQIIVNFQIPGDPPVMPYVYTILYYTIPRPTMNR